MFSPTLLRAIDGVIEALMGVARVVTAFGTDRSSPAEPASAARTLLYRVTVLVIRLIRLSNNGLPTRREPGATPANPDTERTDRDPASRSGFFFPRRFGWLLDALPDDAPILAAQLAAALADPALAPLLDADPALVRDLRPVLRALGLVAPAAPAPSDPPPLPPPPDRPNPPPLGPSSLGPSSALILAPRPLAPNDPAPAAPSHA